MTRPDPLNDRDLDRLLARDAVPTPRADLADRIVAEATRADRVRAIAPPVPRRAIRRPWTRRTMIGLIAINLFAASAIAAAFGGHDGFKRLSTFSAQVIHSIAAAIPHRHRIEPTAHRSRPQVHPAAIARPIVTVGVPARVPMGPVTVRPLLAQRITPVPIGPIRPIRAIARERRLERIAERRTERRALRQARGPEKVWPAHPLGGRRWADRPMGTRRRLADRPGAVAMETARPVDAPIMRGAEAGERAAAPETARNGRPAFEQGRPRADPNDVSTFRERRETRLAQRNWRERAQFRPWKRGGGFRPRRWRR